METINYTKRIGHLFEKVVDIDNIEAAIKNAAKRKSKRPSVKRILDDVPGYALKIQEMLVNQEWVPHPYTIKSIYDGIKKKKRDIAVPRFYPDQCIHHAFIQVFKQVVEHSSYEQSHGCVPGKGTDGAKKSIERWIRNDPKHTKYVGKLDVEKCYPNISHEVLRKKLEKRIKDKKFIWLAFIIIASYQQPLVTGERMLPEADAVGIPVGLYTSPWFLNFFMTDLDHKIASECGIAHSVRYVDDIILFDNNKKRLHKAVRFIQKELGDMRLKMKYNWQVFPLAKRPLDFLGFLFHKGYTTIRKSIMIRISRKAKTIQKQEETAGYVSPTNASGMISYMGYIYHTDSHEFRDKYIKPFVNIKKLKGVISNENRKSHSTACCAA